MNDVHRYPHLFAPIQLGDTSFRNRIFSAPTGLYDLTPQGAPTDDYIKYFERKAKGGAASVNIGECYIDNVGIPVGDSYAVINLSDTVTSHCGLGKLADGVARHGAVATIELQKPGMVSFPDKDGEGIVGPSEGMFYGHYCRALTEEQIYSTIEAFADAALYSKKCGFGMALVHAGHGWLLHQFFSPATNKRTDRWGGSVENRTRFAVMVIDAIHKKCGSGFPVEVRMSGSEVYDGGYGVDEGIAIAKQLDGHADLIHVSVGNIFIPSVMNITHPGIFQEEGCNVKYAAEIKKHVKTPVATVGGLCDPELLEEIIASGKADVVELARGLICDPDLPNKAREGRSREIFRCMRCFKCVGNDYALGHLICALNPESGREWETEAALPPAKKQTVLVAGGGVAGMQAALTASDCGHTVILCEKSDRLGGVLLCEEAVPFKKRVAEYIERQKYMLSKSPVEIRLNTEVTPEYANRLAPDVIIAAVGSVPLLPNIAGIDLPNVQSAEEAFSNPNAVGDRAVILGAGLTGAELGIFLQSFGKHIEIVEMLDADQANMSEAHAAALAKAAVAVRYNTKACEINAQGVRCATPEGDTFLACDTVILALGRKPQRGAVIDLSPCAPRFYQIGDCRKPRNIFEATGEAWTAARHVGRY
jgi:2,4-dienoyl-CoA reductase-like NADH-dependent reductase (Old Yellow Enzyme family)/thioredoxin reductase